jgi:hypothetical protein
MSTATIATNPTTTPAPEPFELAPPKYRTTLPMTPLNGNWFYPDTELEFLQWPKPPLKIVPVNEAARRIAAYYAKHKLEAFLPAAPRHQATGLMYLPGAIPHIRGRENPPAVTIADELPSMPRYTTLLGGRRGDRSMFCNRAIKSEDEEFCYLGWAEPLMLLQAVNAAAEKVMAYQERHQSHFSFPMSPFCVLTRRLFLPVLA